jgi:outer membrane biosynthesis protein TonB
MATRHDLLPRDPFFRWLLIGLGIGLLVLLPVAALLLSARRPAPSTQPDGSVDAARTATAVAIAIRMATITAGPLPTATLPPTQPTTATPPPTPPPATQPPSPQPAPPTQPPPTQPPPPPPRTAQATPTAAAPSATPAPAPAPPQPTVTAPPPTQAPPAASTPTPATGARATPFTGQVSAAGGLANAREDVEAALGRPVGETQSGLAVYRKDQVEYRVQFTEQAAGPADARAITIVRVTPQGTRLSLEGAIREARRLFPGDARPRAIKPEGDDVVVERFASAALARALPEPLFRDRKAQPGEFLAVYLRTRDDQVSHVILGIGDDPALLRETALKP